LAHTTPHLDSKSTKGIRLSVVEADNSINSIKPNQQVLDSSCSFATQFLLYFYFYFHKKSRQQGFFLIFFKNFLISNFSDIKKLANFSKESEKIFEFTLGKYISPKISQLFC
jgi:hypothetical protein